MNTGCELGHETHATITVPTTQGPFTVFDTSLYMDRPGFYCPGQDVVSQNLGMEGVWSADDGAVIGQILQNGDRDRRVIDFGSHIGWFTIMAAKLGYDTWAIDGDTENLRLLRENLDTHDLPACVIHAWVDEDFTIEVLPHSEFELVKIDLESHERHAIAAVWPFIDRIHNFYIEISPVFRPDYPELVDRLTGAGFNPFWPDGHPFDNDYSYDQFNLRLSR